LRPEQQADASAALDSNASQSQSRRRGGGAQDTLDPEIYQAIRAECPGWDLDVLMRQFDSFLNSNPHELPRNYSKRFYGFMKKHHERNKHTLPGFWRSRPSAGLGSGARRAGRAAARLQAWLRSAAGIAIYRNNKNRLIMHGS